MAAAVHVGGAGERKPASDRGMPLTRIRVREVTDVRLCEDVVPNVTMAGQRAESDTATLGARPDVSEGSGGVRPASSPARTAVPGVTAAEGSARKGRRSDVWVVLPSGGRPKTGGASQAVRNVIRSYRHRSGGKDGDLLGRCCRKTDLVSRETFTEN
ncbi:MAG: hypothetical protein ACRDTT_11105 [Pseudonocardiaceae bacterium]